MAAGETAGPRKIGDGSLRCGPEAQVLYEDEWLLALNKPAGIIVHGDGTGARTLTDAARAHLVREGRIEAVAALQPLQRLDRDTTGVVLFSLSKEAQPAFDRMIAERRIAKTYLAICAGIIPWRQRELTWSLGRDRHDARRMRVNPRGKSAHTTARVLETRKGGLATGQTLVELELHTGRKHQIRVHLSHAGFPIRGDALYAEGAAARGPLMLHAWRVRFTHPVTGMPVEIKAPKPKAFSW